MLKILQVLCVGAVVAGVSLVNVPAGLIVGGVLLFALCELFAAAESGGKE